MAKLGRKYRELLKSPIPTQIQTLTLPDSLLKLCVLDTVEDQGPALAALKALPAQ
jgi:hypothetical protein